MRFSSLFKSLLPAITVFSAFCVGSSLASGRPGAETKSQGCPSEDSGLKLPAGFCATIFADDIGHARHLVVAPNGVVLRQYLVRRLLSPGRKASRRRISGGASR